MLVERKRLLVLGKVSSCCRQPEFSAEKRNRILKSLCDLIEDAKSIASKQLRSRDCHVATRWTLEDEDNL